MKSIVLFLFLVTCFRIACAADLPKESAPESAVGILHGQWMFLHSSIAFCVERMPAMKERFNQIRTHAEAEIRKAEDAILRETTDHAESYGRLIDVYKKSWSKRAEDLAEAMKRQDPVGSCPVLADNWESIDSGLILEDWKTFLERSDWEGEQE